MTKGIDELVTGAIEAEPSSEVGRHEMEAGVLATVVKIGLADSGLLQGFNDLTWSRPEMTAIAEAAWECFLNGLSVDPLLIRENLKQAEEVVPENLLLSILDVSTAKEPAVAIEYIKILSKLDCRRRAMDAGRDFLKKVEDGDTDAAVGDPVKTVCDLAVSKRLVKEHAIEADELDAFMIELADRQSSDRNFLGMESGFKHLDEVFNGLMPGLYILAGAPSTGKTTLAKQIADQVAEIEKAPVLFYSYEQSKEELRIKSLSRLAQVNSRDVWKGRTVADTWSKIETAKDQYQRGSARWLTIIEADREDTVAAIRATALMAKHKAGGKRILIILDYLQIMPPPKDVQLDGIKDRVDFNLSELRRISRDLDLPILVISSENRDAYKGNKPPTLAALKESGGIEYTADAVLCLWRNKDESDNLTVEFSRKTIQVEIHVLKNRNGELANIKTAFTPAWAEFIEKDKADLSFEAALGE